MKNVIFSFLILGAFAAAEETVHYDMDGGVSEAAQSETVHYDRRDEAPKTTEETNRPTNELYSK